MNNLVNNLPWDVKSAINKVKNAVLNYTEMESKVREATNNDPWGASGTLLAEIARGSNNYQYFNEIMPMIYKRFTESQKNWRQIYKTLQLVEYLMKNGSEKCVDNVRDHLYEIKVFTSFQFIDEKGKDQGINVRHRAKEIIELVNDVDRLRSEREKAQQNRNKYTGVASEEVRYGGFGNNTSSSFGNDYPGNYSSQSKPEFEPYVPPPRRSSGEQKQQQQPAAVAQRVSQPKQPESNLLDFDFSAPAVQAAPVVQQPQQDQWNAFAAPPPVSSNNDFGNFSSFQSAPTPAQTAFGNFSSFQSAPTQQQNNLTTNFPTLAAPPTQSMNFTPVTAPPAVSAWGDFTSSTPAAVPAQPSFQTSFKPLTPSNSNATQSINAPSSNTSSVTSPNDVWKSNLVSLDSLGKNNQPQNQAPALNQLAASNPQQQQQPAFGNFSSFQTAQPAVPAMGGWSSFTVQPAVNASVPQMNGFGAFSGFQSVQQPKTANGFPALTPTGQQQQQKQDQGFGAFQQSNNLLL